MSRRAEALTRGTYANTLPQPLGIARPVGRAGGIAGHAASPARSHTCTTHSEAHATQ